MSALILDGKALAAKMKENIRLEAATLPRQPGLAVILVGDNGASQVYAHLSFPPKRFRSFLQELRIFFRWFRSCNRASPALLRSGRNMRPSFRAP